MKTLSIFMGEDYAPKAARPLAWRYVSKSPM